MSPYSPHNHRRVLWVSAQCVFRYSAVLHLPVVPLRPYAEGLAGVAKLNYSQSDLTDNSTDLAYGFSLGLDFTFFSHLDWRVLDFTYTRLQDTDTTNQKSLTTGLVLRIPLS